MPNLYSKKQTSSKTCYANVIAAVLHLAMHRIVGREGGHPKFKEIHQRLIDDRGTEGADTKKKYARFSTLNKSMKYVQDKP